MSIINDYQEQNDPRQDYMLNVPKVTTPPALQPLANAGQAIDSRDSLVSPQAVTPGELLQDFQPVDALPTQIPQASPDYSAFQTRDEIMAPFDAEAQSELTQFFKQAQEDAERAELIGSHLPTLVSGASSADRAMADAYTKRIGELITSANQMVQPTPQPKMSASAFDEAFPLQTPFGFKQDVLGSPKKTIGNPWMMDDDDKQEFAPRKTKFGQFGEGPLGAAFYGLNAVFGTPVAGIVDLANNAFATAAGVKDALTEDVNATNPVDWAVKKAKRQRERYLDYMEAQYPTGQTYAQQALLGRDFGSLGANLNGAENDSYTKRYGSLSPLAYGLDAVLKTRDEDYDALYKSSLPKWQKDALATFKGLARTGTGLFVDVFVAPDNIGDAATGIRNAVKGVQQSRIMAQQLPFGQFTPKGTLVHQPRGSLFTTQVRQDVENVRPFDVKADNNKRRSKKRSVMRPNQGTDYGYVPDLEGEVVKFLPSHVTGEFVEAGGTILRPGQGTNYGTVIDLEAALVKQPKALPGLVQKELPKLPPVTTIDVTARVIQDRFVSDAILSTQPLPVRVGSETQKAIGVSSSKGMLLLEAAPYELKMVALEDVIRPQLKYMEIPTNVWDEAQTLLPVVDDLEVPGVVNTSVLQLPGSMPVAALPPATRRVVTRPEVTQNGVLITGYSQPTLSELRDLAFSVKNPVEAFGDRVGLDIHRFREFYIDLDAYHTIMDFHYQLYRKTGLDHDRSTAAAMGKLVLEPHKRKAVIDSARKAFGLDSLQFADNVADGEVINSLYNGVEKLGDRPANIRNVLIAHGDGTYLNGDWVLENNGTSVQDAVNSRYPKGTRVHVLACETCDKKKFSEGWDRLIEITSEGYKVESDPVMRQALKLHREATKLIGDSSIAPTTTARDSLFEAANKKTSEALELLKGYKLEEYELDDFVEHVTNGKAPSEFAPERLEDPQAPNLVVSEQAASSQPASVVSPEPVSDTLTPAAVSSDASGIITGSEGKVNPVQIPTYYPSPRTFDALVDAKALGLPAADRLEAAKSLQEVAGHVVDGKSVDEAIALVNSGVPSGTTDNVESTMVQLHQEARKRLGVEDLSVTANKSKLREEIKQYRFDFVKGENSGELLEYYTDRVRASLGLDSLKFSDTKDLEDSLRTLLSLLDQASINYKPDDIKNAVMAHGNGVVKDGTWTITKSGESAWDAVASMYPAGTRVHVYACESCFKRKLDSPYFWDSFVAITAGDDTTPHSVSVERIVNTYSPEDLPKLIAEHANQPNAVFNGKASVPKTRPARTLHRLGGLIPHPDGSGAPLLAPLMEHVEAYQATYSKPHPYALYAKSQPRILNGGGGKRKSITDLAADLGNLYGSLYQKLLSPSGEPISDQLLEALEQGVATGRGIVLDFGNGKGVKLDLPKVEEPQAPNLVVSQVEDLETLRASKVAEYAQVKGVDPERVVITDGSNAKLLWQGKGQPNFSVFGTAEQAAAKRAKLTEPEAPKVTQKEDISLNDIVAKAEASMAKATDPLKLQQIYDRAIKRIGDSEFLPGLRVQLDEMLELNERRLTSPFAGVSPDVQDILDDLASQVINEVANEAELIKGIDSTKAAEDELLDTFPTRVLVNSSTSDIGSKGRAAALEKTLQDTGLGITGDRQLDVSRLMYYNELVDSHSAEEALSIVNSTSWTQPPSTLAYVENPTALYQEVRKVYLDSPTTPASEVAAKVEALTPTVAKEAGLEKLVILDSLTPHEKASWLHSIVEDVLTNSNSKPEGASILVVGHGTGKRADGTWEFTKYGNVQEWVDSNFPHGTTVHVAACESCFTKNITMRGWGGIPVTSGSPTAPRRITDEYQYLQRLLEAVNSASKSGTSKEVHSIFLAQYKDALVKASTDARAVQEDLASQLFEAYDKLLEVQKTQKVDYSDSVKSYNETLNVETGKNGVCD